MKKNDIGIDTRMIDCTGIGTYTQGLLSGFVNLGKKQCTLYGPNVEHIETLEHFKRINFESPIYSLAEQFEYQKHLKECKVWHATHYNIPLFKPKGVKLIATVHDLIHWIFRKKYFGPLQRLYAKTMFTAVVRNCDHIISVSEHTKKDLIRYFDAIPDKITVISEAVGKEFRVLGDDALLLRKELGGLPLPEDFFLFVGSLKPHKNLEWLMSVFEKLHADKKSTAPLVIVGKADLKYPSVLLKIKELQKKGVVLHLEGINTQTLVRIYNLSLALIHPSEYEGFGLTILEAMACGTAVITCPNASIPEVAGAAAWMVDSGSENGMMQAILTLENDIRQRKELQQKGKERVLNFSWDKTAQATYKIYEHLLK